MSGGVPDLFNVTLYSPVRVRARWISLVTRQPQSDWLWARILPGGATIAIDTPTRTATCAVPSRHSEIHPDDRGFFPHLNGAA